jgi:hypothetical protein
MIFHDLPIFRPLLFVNFAPPFVFRRTVEESEAGCHEKLLPLAPEDGVEGQILRADLRQITGKLTKFSYGKSPCFNR